MTLTAASTVVGIGESSQLAMRFTEHAVADLPIS
jgi:hypothetical protein